MSDQIPSEKDISYLRLKLVDRRIAADSHLVLRINLSISCCTGHGGLRGSGREGDIHPPRPPPRPPPKLLPPRPREPPRKDMSLMLAVDLKIVKFPV